MNVIGRFIILIVLILIANKAFSGTITLVPSGTNNDSELIQTTLDGLNDGDSLLLNGDFIIARTIYLPSNFTWILNGTLTLSTSPSLDKAGWEGTVSGYPVKALKYTGITEKNWNTTGSSNINMSGGIYNGNYVSQGSSRVRFINFVRVTNSNFHDMDIKKASDDNFTLGPDSRFNECRNLVSTLAGLSPGSSSGNALTDKGDNNKWYDCVAADCTSDGWTPKCRFSEFHRCIARGNEGPGFGMFCRIDGSGNPVDLGEKIEGNKFYACEAFDNNAAGFSFNISSTSGEGGAIRNNYVEAKCYNNASSGVRFRNKMPNSIVDNNEINLVCYGNRGQKKSGGLSSVNGGLGNDANSTYRVTGITGKMVSYDNKVADVNTDKAYNCSITVYHPIAENAPILKKGDASNSINVIDFICSDSLDVWCVQEYCRGISIIPPADPDNLTANAVSSGQINLSWTDNSISEAGFKIERKTAGSFIEIANVESNVTSYSDTSLNASTTYTYRVRAYNVAGNSAYSSEASATTDVSTGIYSVTVKTGKSIDYKNYPNPFSLETAISYHLTNDTHVSLCILNLQGQIICDLIKNEYHTTGTYSKVWKGINNSGLPVSAGTYFCVIQLMNKEGVLTNSLKMNFIK